MRRGARGLGKQLAAKADAEDRDAAIKVLAEERLLRVQPWVLVVLIDMHRAAEDEERVGHRQAAAPALGTHVGNSPNTPAPASSS